MRQLRPRDERTFAPLRDKSLSSVLRHLFVTEFGYDKKVVFAEVMIERILEVLETFLHPLPALKPGQMVWMAVRRDRSKHTFESMKDTPKVPLILDVVTDEDLRALAAGESQLKVRRRRHARLLEQSLAQGGVLAQSDLCAISLASEDQVRGDIEHVQRVEERRLPYRGSVQDIGPTLSHKLDVARLLEAGHLEPEICRRLSPVHDLRSVERYAQTYKNVLKLLERGFAAEEISGILSLSQRLVRCYVAIVEKYHPEVLAAKAKPGGLSSGAPPVLTDGS